MGAKSNKGKLTNKQLAFCREYVKNGWNGTQAAIDAGYSKETAAVIASQNLTKLNILEQIDRNKADLEMVLRVSKTKVLYEHMKIAFSSISDMHENWITRKDFEGLTGYQKACIAEITTQTRIEKGADEVEREVDYVKIKLYDKQKALDSISKMMGYNEPEKVSVTEEVTGFNITIVKG